MDKATKKKSKTKKWKSPEFAVRMSIKVPGEKKPAGIVVEFTLEGKPDGSAPTDTQIVTAMMRTIENIVRDNVKVEVKQDDSDWRDYQVCGDRF